MKLDAGNDDIYEYHGKYSQIPLNCHFVAVKQSKSLLFLFKKKKNIIIILKAFNAN